jgi:hypothetical protein
MIDPAVLAAFAALGEFGTGGSPRHVLAALAAAHQAEPKEREPVYAVARAYWVWMHGDTPTEDDDDLKECIALLDFAQGITAAFMTKAVVGALDLHASFPFYDRLGEPAPPPENDHV